jgi:3-methylfumaryl-CoA hydratase
MSQAWSAWIGRTQEARDVIAAGPARALAATLDHDDVEFGRGAEIPGLWVWLFFLPHARMRDIGPDGHPKRGGFLPPIAAPRRMWAGSRSTFHAPLRIGDALIRTSTIEAIAEKPGRSGDLTFLTLRHRVESETALIYEEEQDIVFMPIPERFSPPSPVAPPQCAWTDAVSVDPVLLFRFSALTFNGHRIHYDRAYAQDVEHYPGLVVHGPLQAVLMFDAALRHSPGRRPAHFAFRGLRPLFDFDRISIRGAPLDDGALDVSTVNDEDAIGARATLTFVD